MSCPGDNGPSGETTAAAACRAAWRDSTGKAWQEYALGQIDYQELRNRLDAANAAFAACMASSSGGQ